MKVQCKGVNAVAQCPANKSGLHQRSRRIREAGDKTVGLPAEDGLICTGRDGKVRGTGGAGNNNVIGRIDTESIHLLGSADGPAETSKIGVLQYSTFPLGPILTTNLS